MEHRTYGETKNCKGCRYWSEMLARCDGGPVLAYCLAPDCRSGATMGGKWTAGSQKCEAWASGELGAIDEPGSDPDRYDDKRHNAEAHGRAVARTVQPLVGSLDGGE